MRHRRLVSSANPPFHFPISLLSLSFSSEDCGGDQRRGLQVPSHELLFTFLLCSALRSLVWVNGTETGDDTHAMEQYNLQALADTESAPIPLSPSSSSSRSSFSEGHLLIRMLSLGVNDVHKEIWTSLGQLKLCFVFQGGLAQCRLGV